MMSRKRVILAAVAAWFLAAMAAVPPAQAQDLGKEDDLLAVLQSADSSDHDIAVACEKLAVVGTKKAVPLLAKMLSSKKFAHYARFGLEPIPDPAVDEALREAMGKLHGMLLVGVMNSIGVRRDTAAIEGLAAHLEDADAEVATAAAAALGRIGTPQAAKILTGALPRAPAAERARVADSCLRCAETLLAAGKRDEAVAVYDAVREVKLPKYAHIAATQGAILARGEKGLSLLAQQLGDEDEEMFGLGLRTARLLKSKKAVGLLMAMLNTPSPKRKALLVRALGDCGDAMALASVTAAAKAGPERVRLAAIESLTRLGDASSVPVLVAAALEPDEEISQAARTSLEGLRAEGIDEAILGKLPTSEGRTRTLLVGLIGARGIGSAVPVLMKTAKEGEGELRLAAIRALGTTIGLEDLPGLTARLIEAKAADEKAAVEEALRAASIRMPDRERCAEKIAASLPKAPVEAKVFLLELLGSVGGTNALEAVAASARDADDAIQDAATRVLGGWISADAAAPLLDLAKTLKSKKYRIRALRGYIRIARQLHVSNEERLAICGNTLAAAERADEKKLVLEVLRRNPSEGSLGLAMTLVGQRGLNEPACATAIGIAEKIAGSSPAAVAKAMRQVAEATGNADRAAKAKALAKRAGG